MFAIKGKKNRPAPKKSASVKSSPPKNAPTIIPPIQAGVLEGFSVKTEIDGKIVEISCPATILNAQELLIQESKCKAHTIGQVEDHEDPNKTKKITPSAEGLENDPDYAQFKKFKEFLAKTGTTIANDVHDEPDDEDEAEDGDSDKTYFPTKD